MSENVQVTTDKESDLAQLANLTRRELKELEEKEKTPVQKMLEVIIMILPVICGGIALLEYRLIPDLKMNINPMYYVYVLVFLIGVYCCCGVVAAYNKWKGNKIFYEKVRYAAPLCSCLLELS